MPINLSIKSPYVSGLNVFNTIVAAFDGASYPIKVMVSNLSNNGDVFPLVGGIIETDHDINQNDFVRAKKLSLASAAEMQKLAANIERLAQKVTEPDVQYVIQEIDANSTVSVNSQPYKTGKPWYGDQFVSASDPYLPDAAAYGVGMVWLGGALYWSDGTSYAAAGGGGGGATSETALVSASRATTAADDGDYLANNSANNYTITVDPDMPANFGLALLQASTGTLTFAAGAGVTLTGNSLVTSEAIRALSLVYISPNNYLVL
jgi:hypothetical protein